MSNIPAAEQIRSIIERVEHLNQEIAGLNEGKSEIFQEAKSNGLDVPALKEVVRIRRQDRAAYRERETLVDLYRQALGDFG